MPPAPVATPSQWERCLWKRQAYPDNYTDARFLEHLVLNSDVQPRSYWRVVLESAPIAQQTSTAAAALTVPVSLHRGVLATPTLLCVNGLLLVCAVVFCGALGGHVLGGTLRQGARQLCLLTVAVYCMAPLTQTLTISISTDTVAAAACCLLLLHLFLFDYNFMKGLTDKLTGGLSLAAGVAASVLVASRLGENLAVFAHILFSLQLYLVYPYVVLYVKQRSTVAHVCVTVGSCAAEVALLLRLSIAAGVAYVSALLFMCFICPWWLLRIHKFKAKINGPWDEALPSIPDVWTTPTLPQAAQEAEKAHPTNTSRGARTHEA